MWATIATIDLLAVSDLHRDLDATERVVEQSSAADLVIVAGDLAVWRAGLEQVVAVLARIEAPAIVVPGNHETETALREACAAAGWQRATVLHGSGCQIDGVEFFGLGHAVPPTPFPQSLDLDEDSARELLAGCPDGAVLAAGRLRPHPRVLGTAGVRRAQPGRQRRPGGRTPAHLNERRGAPAPRSCAPPRPAVCRILCKVGAGRHSSKGFVTVGAQSAQRADSEDDRARLRRRSSRPSVPSRPRATRTRCPPPVSGSPPVRGVRSAAVR